MSNSENNKRIAKNTMMLYFRMILTMAVSLYTSRIILKILGVEDYGIYNVVGGVVVMFSSINTTMATAVQRFMNFEMGKSNKKKLNLIFNTSIIIHIGIAVAAFLLLETVGVWFLNQKMNISADRLNAANWVLQFSILTFIITILSVPYNATIIANERMKAFAYIGILEVVLKLFIVYSLSWFEFDKLKLYAILTFGVAVLLRFIYGIYAKRNFSECDFHWQWDKRVCVEMTSFAGWNMIGVTSTIIRNQGVNIVLNLFFGTIVNAAMGIANQVKNAIESFTNNFITALSPQITKSYASGDLPYLMNLIFKGSRYIYYLFLFLAMPILLNTEFILKTWLKIVPEYTTIFIQLILVTSLIETLSKTLIQTMFANGNIKNYQIIVGSVTLLNIPLAILFLHWGYKPYIVMVIAIVIAIISLVVRLVLLRSMVQLNVKDFTKKVISNVILVSLISLLTPLILNLYLDKSVTSFFLTEIVCVFSVTLSIFFVGLSSSERLMVKEKVYNYLKRQR